MDYDIDIRLLSYDFLADYPVDRFPELMWKHGRPYACLMIDTHEDYLICIPFRSSIAHKNAYLFQKSKRSQRTSSGLDYTKIALIDKEKYIDDTSAAIVDNDEYVETMRNISKIIKDVDIYISDYCKHITGIKPLNIREFERKYRYSTLQYFHDILKIKPV